MTDLSPADRRHLLDVVMATEAALRNLLDPTRSTSPASATWCRTCTGT
jgi:hypothetical protein